MTKETQNSHPLIDALTSEGGAKTDSSLSRILGVNPSTICNMRRTGRVSDEFRLAVMRRLDWSLKRLDALAPPTEKK